MKQRKQTRYRSVGFCIYCGATEGQLSDEHIIPFALGGDYLLPKSSCAACAKITSGIEQFCLRTMFGPLRMMLGFPTRRPKERPTTLPVILTMPDKSRRPVDIPVVEHPMAVAFFMPPPAKALIGGELDEKGLMNVLIWRYPEIPKVEHILKKYGAISCEITYLTFETLQFSKLLAKIAHGWAFANEPQDYDQLAPDVILGKVNDPNAIVGSQYAIPKFHDGNQVMSINSGRHPDMGKVMVAIQFFPNLDGPTYHVVVGNIRGRGEPSDRRP